MNNIQHRYATILRRTQGTGVATQYEGVAKHFAEIDNLCKAFGIRFEPDKYFEQYVRLVASIENDLMCRHHKFNWHVCSRCHRDKPQAYAYREHCARRVKSILST